jgi:hypothetical protein
VPGPGYRGRLSPAVTARGEGRGLAKICAALRAGLARTVRTAPRPAPLLSWGNRWPGARPFDRRADQSRARSGQSRSSAPSAGGGADRLEAGAPEDPGPREAHPAAGIGGAAVAREPPNAPALARGGGRGLGCGLGSRRRDDRPHPCRRGRSTCSPHLGSEPTQTCALPSIRRGRAAANDERRRASAEPPQSPQT